MKEYGYYGYNELIICGGQKEEYIKEWFGKYFVQNWDVRLKLGKGKNEISVDD